MPNDHVITAQQRGCPICNGNGFPFYTTGDYLFYRCGNCQSSFLHPMPSAEELEQYYAHYHRPDAQGGRYDWIEERIARTFPAKVDLVQRVSGAKPGRLLDHGCGKGIFVKRCVERGMDAQGIDLSTSGVEYAVQKLGVRATAGDLSELKGALGQFDTVTSWATFEHVPNGRAMVRDIRDILRPNGHLLLLTCAGNDLTERLLPGVTQWYAPPDHVVIYSRQGITQLLESEGFEVTSIEIGWEYSFARKIMRFVRNTGLAAAKRMKRALVGPRMALPYTERFPLGNDMMVVARKRDSQV